VRAAFDLGAPVATSTALRAVHRKIVQALTLACGPAPGPVHVNLPFRKPLEPALPSTETETSLAVAAAALRAPIAVAPPRLAPDPTACAALARTIADEPHGLIVAGALPVDLPRDRVLAFAAHTGYPLVAETGSQLRFAPRPDDVVFVDHFDLIPPGDLPSPALVIQLGAEPVAAAWPRFIAGASPRRFILADHAWHDPESTAHVVLGGTDTTLTTLGAQLREIATARGTDTKCTTCRTWRDRWAALERDAAGAAEAAMASHPQSETALVRAAIAAMPEGAALQVGNSLPIRVVDHSCAGGPRRAVITQRGAAGIDGLIASAAGATPAGAPVLLVLGDVSFAHDLGGLLAARAAAAPLAILVVDNRGGQIFAGLPIARSELGGAFADHWLTAPAIDPAAVATALASPGVTVIHAPVSVSGAHDVRRTAIELGSAATVSQPWRKERTS
jgi:2-succinyl-5-enolpyruvyl-6-hydroxy-3-cyclohexene-1-carboxylate synthase